MVKVSRSAKKLRCGRSAESPEAYRYGTSPGGPGSKPGGLRRMILLAVTRELTDHGGELGYHAILTCRVLSTSWSFLILTPAPRAATV